MSSKGEKDVQLILDQLAQCKGTITQFVAMLLSIVTKAPTRNEWNSAMQVLREGSKSGESPATLERLQAAMEWPHTKIAVRLKELYDEERLPLLNALTKINLKQIGDPRPLDFFLDYNPIVEYKDELALRQITQSNSKRSRVDISSYPPILPSIKSKALAIRASTDKSYRRFEDFLEVSPKDFQKSHNGRLAIKGRAVMQLCLVEVLEEARTNLLDEDIELISKKLLSNRILSKFAFGYNLVDISKYNLSVDADFEEKTEVIGNLFLAHIGSLRTENYDMQDLKVFVRKLYEPVIDDYIKSNNPLAKFALMELDLLFKSITNLKYCPHTNFHYEIREAGTDPFVVKICVDGIELGRGVSYSNHEEAKYRAANEVFGESGEGLRKIWAALTANAQENASAIMESKPMAAITAGPHSFASTMKTISMPVPIPSAPPLSIQAPLVVVGGIAPHQEGSAVAGSANMQLHQQLTPQQQEQLLEQQQQEHQQQNYQQESYSLTAGSMSPTLGRPDQTTPTQNKSNSNTPVAKNQQMYLQQQPQNAQQAPPLSFYPYQQAGFSQYPSYPPQQANQSPIQTLYSIQPTYSSISQTPTPAQIPLEIQAPTSAASPNPMNQLVTPASRFPGAVYENGILTLPLSAACDNSAKSTFNTLVSQTKIAPANYNTIEMAHPHDKNLKMFYTTLSVGDIYLGAGYGANKKESGHKAAMCALHNPEKCIQVGLMVPMA